MITPIDHGDLRRVDLNLLVVLGALYVERSATRAGQRLGMSQAAVSGALARLRRTFRDPLFVRVPGGLAPTSRAVAIARTLEPILGTLAELVRDTQTFTPGQGPHWFTVGASDDIEAFLLPTLLDEMLHHHPTVRIQVRQTNRHLAARMLDDAEIDLAVVAAPALTDAHRREALCTSRYACLHNPELVEVVPPLTLTDYLETPHVLVSFDGRRGIVDEVLEAQGLRRTVAASTTHFAGVIGLLSTCPVIATIPEHAARAFTAVNPRLQLSSPPVEMPEFVVSLAWHDARSRDPAHVWLREQIHRACATIR